MKLESCFMAHIINCFGFVTFSNTMAVDVKNAQIWVKKNSLGANI